MSNTEKLIKQLKEIKEIRNQKEKDIKPAVRIQELKNKLIILAHELSKNKNINDALYRKIQLLTYSKTSEKKLNESYDILKNIKTNIGKSNELKIKTKKSTVQDFKKENNKTKHEKELDKILDKNADKLKQYDNLVPYKGFINEKGDDIYYHFFNYIQDKYLTEISEEYLKIKEYKRGENKDYVPIEKTEHTRKKTFIYPFNGNVTKILNMSVLTMG